MKIRILKKLVILWIIITPLLSTSLLMSVLANSNNLTTWVKTNGPYGGNIFTIEFDPNDPDIIYAGGKGGVFRSTDEGTTWVKLGEFLFGSKISNSIVDLLIPSENSLILYALCSSHEGGDLFRSINGGFNWTEIDKDLTFDCIAIHPDNASIITGIAHGKSVLYSENYGGTWNNITGNLPKDSISDIDITSSGDIWIGTNNGINGSLYYTSNYGINWNKKEIGQPDNTCINSLVISSGNDEVIYTSLINAIDTTPNMSDPYMFKSEDGGNVWIKY